MVLLLLLRQSKDARYHASVVEPCNVAWKTGTSRRPTLAEVGIVLWSIFTSAVHRRAPAAYDWRQRQLAVAGRDTNRQIANRT